MVYQVIHRRGQYTPVPYRACNNDMVYYNGALWYIMVYYHSVLVYYKMVYQPYPGGVIPTLPYTTHE